jgi:hypothetical protein
VAIILLVTGIVAVVVLGAGGGRTIGIKTPPSPPEDENGPTSQLTTVAPPAGDSLPGRGFDANATMARLDDPALRSALGLRSVLTSPAPQPSFAPTWGLRIGSSQTTGDAPERGTAPGAAITLLADSRVSPADLSTWPDRQVAFTEIQVWPTSPALNGQDLIGKLQSVVPTSPAPSEKADLPSLGVGTASAGSQMIATQGAIVEHYDVGDDSAGMVIDVVDACKACSFATGAQHESSVRTALALLTP